VRVLVIPVKRLDAAKTRLGEQLGPRRRDLALAFAADTVAAVLATPGAHALVVTDDELARAAVLALGAEVVPDTPDAGLNAAVVHAAGKARDRHPDAEVGALSADLPALRPHDLAAAMSAVGAAGGFVCDVSGDGTTLLLAAHGQPLRPRFGPASAQAHRADGLAEVRGPVPSLRQDVDTPADLAAAARLGLGPRTVAVLQDIPGPWNSAG
jgi:2-phospho-L-lactate guanylyltransferase